MAPNVVTSDSSIRLIRKRELARLLSVSHSSIDRLVASGDLPRPVRISLGSVGWRSDDVDKFIASRQARETHAKVADRALETIKTERTKILDARFDVHEAKAALDRATDDDEVDEAQAALEDAEARAATTIADVEFALGSFSTDVSDDDTK